MRGKFCLAAMLLAVLIPAVLAAQSPSFFVLHQEVAKPPMLKQYEETTKEFTAAVKRHHELSPAFSFTAIAGDDNLYTYVTPIRSMADLESIYKGFGALAQAEGAKWGDLMKRAGETMEYARESIVMEDPSLSYTPEKPRLKPEEQAYLHVDLYYVKPGYEAEADAVAREFADLFRRKKMADGYRLFKVVLGPETPLLMVVVGAKDPADFAAADKANREALGAEGQALFQRAFAFTRRFEQHGGWVRPDLSLAPVATNAKK
jgi:hypothetical protein